MTFVSYAQNQEDVMLYRALRDVKQGFYIDVGAQDPVVDSVTKAFYDRGWRGINIEPAEEYFQQLQSERPHDVNLMTAVGRETGTIDFYEVTHTGLSTTNPGYAQRHAEAGYEVQRRQVACTTLDRICAEYGVGTVDFLKIDVEGSEREVLEGFSFETVRPRLVVVEATEPNSEQQTFTQWEDLLVERGYRFVYFDGLNRFYAAEEHAELTEYFSRPPNWFDQYVTYELWRARAELDELQAAERNALVSSLNHMLAELRDVRAEADTGRDATVERERQLVSLSQAAVERERQLVGLHDTFVEREQTFQKTAAERELTLRNAIAEREQMLRNAVAEREQALQEAIVDRERHVIGLEESLAEHERQLLELKGSLAEREQQVLSLHRALVEKEQRLKAVRSSLSWKLTRPVREARRAALRIAGLFHQPQPSPPNVTSACAASDLTASDKLAAGLTEPVQMLYRNLHNGAALERAIRKKRI